MIAHVDHNRCSSPGVELAETFTVLVVDDIVSSTAELLRLSGFRVQTAAGGEAAVAAASEEPPDVILLDLRMPGLDGYEVARRVRATAGIKPSLLIAMTACGFPLDQARTAAEGFHLHLVKPVDPVVLVGVLQRIRMGIVSSPHDGGDAGANHHDGGRGAVAPAAAKTPPVR
jgi:CheY-like chemotaxis protein